MKNKTEHYNALDAINDMVKQIRTVNEAVRFGDFENEEMNGMDDEEMPVNPEGEADGMADLAKVDAEPEAMPKGEPDPEEGMRELGEVDQIREIALRGMIKLCKNPEDDRYQALKKIFQFCDKAAENKDKEVEA